MNVTTRGATERARELATIRETLFTGGYDGTEGQKGSRDTTWTDFGIVCGIADALASALEDAERFGNEWGEESAMMLRRAEDAELENKRLAKWTVYVHAKDCDKSSLFPAKCNCGLDDALAVPSEQPDEEGT